MAKVKPFSIQLAVDPGALASGEEWHAARIGKVYDPTSGAFIIDVTEHMLDECVTAFDAFGSRLGTTLMRDHGKPDRALRGVVESMRVEPGVGLLIKANLSQLGRDEVASESPALWLSPGIRGPAVDPATGEQVAEYWIEEVSLTGAPRQDGLSAVALARGGDDPVTMFGNLARFEGPDGSASAHREQLRDAAVVALNAISVTPEHVSVSDWSDSMVVVNGWRYDDGAGYDKVWRFDVADVDGKPVLTNPIEGSMVRSFEPGASSTILSRDDADNDSPPEAGVEGTMPKDETIELSRVDHDALKTEAGKVGELTTELGRYTSETGAYSVELARLKGVEQAGITATANAAADDFVGTLTVEGEDAKPWHAMHVIDPAQAVSLSRTLLKANVDASEFEATLLARGAVAADQAPKWGERYKTDPEGTKACAALLPDEGVVKLGRSAGSSERGKDAPDDGALRAVKLARIAEIRKEDGSTYDVALGRYESEVA